MKLRYNVALLLFFFAIPLMGVEFLNLGSIQWGLGFQPYYRLQPEARLKIAILDKGFSGYEEKIGISLPGDTVFHPGVIESEETTEHGTIMAELVVALMSDKMKLQSLMPELHLYQVNGFTNFKSAIKDLIKQKVNLVLYSEVWEYGSNWDGYGFINTEVNKALDEGIIWVNAAGNFETFTYQSKIQKNDSDLIDLPCKGKSIEVRCLKNKSEKCQLRLVLSWNDFKDETDVGTDLDLDMALSDGFQVLKESSLKQVLSGADSPTTTLYPREIIRAEVQEGLYYLRIKNQSKNFDETHAFRLTVSGDFVELPSRCVNGNINRTNVESILNPADNSRVITVGALDSERSSVSKVLNKPDIWAPSSIIIGKNEEYRGTSNSAAIVASGLGLLLANDPELDREDLLSLITRRSSSFESSKWSLGFGPTGPQCYIENLNYQWPYYIQDILRQGGRVVESTAGLKIMLDRDPFSLQPQMRRIREDDIIAVSQWGYRMFPRRQVTNLPYGYIEIFQKTEGIRLCSEPLQDGRPQFFLPRF